MVVYEVSARLRVAFSTCASLGTPSGQVGTLHLWSLDRFWTDLGRLLGRIWPKLGLRLADFGGLWRPGDELGWWFLDLDGLPVRVSVAFRACVRLRTTCGEADPPYLWSLDRFWPDSGRFRGRVWPKSSLRMADFGAFSLPQNASGWQFRALNRLPARLCATTCTCEPWCIPRDHLGTPPIRSIDRFFN